MEEEKITKAPEETPRPSAWPNFLTVMALVIGLAAFGYGIRQSQNATELTTQNAEMASTIKDLQLQTGALAAKVTELATPPPQPVATAASTRATKARRAADDKRWKEVQAKLADHEKGLATAREEVERTRTDLDGRLTSTRDELGGSIARTDGELALLKKRGERDFTEFDLSKSKQLQRTGPISIALRKVDTKHKRYNVDLLVDDARLEKKNVNLYEPIWIHRADDPQPVQVVVYEIAKDRVRGYVNAPKFRQSELAPSAPTEPVPQPPPPAIMQ